MFFKPRGDLKPQNDHTLVMEGAWYDSQEDADDEDIQPIELGQIRIPVMDPAHVTADLLEDLIVERAEEIEKTRTRVTLPPALEKTFGRNKTLNVDAMKGRVEKRRAERRGRR